ncbi:TPA_asm: P [Hepatica betacytorhabdovirus 1]|nr:TPA_asm: P [Hepatica betacytorhabdovirus 1]
MLSLSSDIPFYHFLRPILVYFLVFIWILLFLLIWTYLSGKMAGLFADTPEITEQTSLLGDDENAEYDDGLYQVVNVGGTNPEADDGKSEKSTGSTLNSLDSPKQTTPIFPLPKQPISTKPKTFIKAHSSGGIQAIGASSKGFTPTEPDMELFSKEIVVKSFQKLCSDNGIICLQEWSDHVVRQLNQSGSIFHSQLDYLVQGITLERRFSTGKELKDTQMQLQNEVGRLIHSNKELKEQLKSFHQEGVRVNTNSEAQTVKLEKLINQVQNIILKSGSVEKENTSGSEEKQPTYTDMVNHFLESVDFNKVQINHPRMGKYCKEYLSEDFIVSFWSGEIDTEKAVQMKSGLVAHITAGETKYKMHNPSPASSSVASSGRGRVIIKKA